MDKQIYDIILKNENSLLASATRCSCHHLNKLLADNFVEFGSSGNIYYKQDILARLPHENNCTFIMENSLLRQIDNHTFLLTYKAKKIHSDGKMLANRLEAKVVIEDWRLHYNDVRPHSSLDYKTPNEFKRGLGHQIMSDNLTTGAHYSM